MQQLFLTKKDCGHPLPITAERMPIKMNEVMISKETVRMFRRIMRPLAEEGVIPLPEYNEAISQLTSLAEHGKPKPLLIPRLIDMKEAAELLGIGLSNFKKLESEGAFPFKRKMVGSSVRYRNTDLYEFLLSE